MLTAIIYRARKNRKEAISRRVKKGLLATGRRVRECSASPAVPLHLNGVGRGSTALYVLKNPKNKSGRTCPAVLCALGRCLPQPPYQPSQSLLGSKNGGKPGTNSLTAQTFRVQQTSPLRPPVQIPQSLNEQRSLCRGFHHALSAISSGTSGISLEKVPRPSESSPRGIPGDCSNHFAKGGPLGILPESTRQAWPIQIPFQERPTAEKKSRTDTDPARKTVNFSHSNSG